MVRDLEGKLKECLAKSYQDVDVSKSVSELLSDEEYKDVISWLPNGRKLTLLYKGSRDGFDSVSFHNKCDK